MLRSSIIIFSLIAGLFLSLLGCSNDSIEDIHPGIYDPPVVPCDTAGMTYTKDLIPIFAASCGSGDINCHKTGNTQGDNLDNYADVKDLAVNDDLMGSILHLPGYSPMPNTGGMLDQCSINKIQAWINSGYPQ
jgi:hypothetical protein